MQSPLTLKQDASLLKVISPQEISQRWASELGVMWEPPCSVSAIQYWRDPSTGLCFYSPSDVVGGPELYRQLQLFPWYYMQDKWEFSVALKLLRRLPSPLRILEVGVGQGAFLEQARHAGHCVSGMETNSEAAQVARDKGFNIFESNLLSLRGIHDGCWDVICAFQVLEHLPHPRCFFEDALALLKPGGLLILSVPNAEVARFNDPDRVELLDQPPHHMSHWDLGVFRSLVNFLPVRLAEAYFEPLALYHIDWFVAAWRKRLRQKLGRRISRLLLGESCVSLFKLFLRLGLRRFFKGHTLLVSLAKS